jgi:DNA-binding FadR family transcriptional regulator
MQINTRLKLYEQVVEAIGLQIIAGKFTPGESLPNEDNLGTELGVSRTVIREAVKVLVDKGLVQSQPKIGTQIQPREHWNLLDPDIMNWEHRVGKSDRLFQEITEIRSIVEPEAARLAAQRASEADINAIKLAYREMEQSTEDIDNYVEADMRFHHFLLNACGNERLTQLANTMRQARKTSFQITTRTPTDARTALPLHFAVLWAIQNRDAEAACSATRALIESAQNDLNNATQQTNQANL